MSVMLDRKHGRYGTPRLRRRARNRRRMNVRPRQTLGLGTPRAQPLAGLTHPALGPSREVHLALSEIFIVLMSFWWE